MPPAKRSTAKSTGKPTPSAVVVPVTEPPNVESAVPVDSNQEPQTVMPVIKPQNPLIAGGARKVHFDETDVAFALARKTQDGKGDDPLPPSDWTGYADPTAVKEAGT